MQSVSACVKASLLVRCFPSAAASAINRSSSLRFSDSIHLRHIFIQMDLCRSRHFPLCDAG